MGTKDGKESTIVTIKDWLKNGTWKPTDAAITFDDAGLLIDGRHRLEGAVQSGVDVDMKVVTRAVK